MFDLCTDFLSTFPEPHNVLSKKSVSKGAERPPERHRGSFEDVVSSTASFGGPFVDQAKRSQHSLSGPHEVP